MRSARARKRVNSHCRRQLYPPMSSLSHLEPESRPGVSGGERATRGATAKAEAASDADLMRRFVEEEGDAFIEIVRRHQGRISKLALGCSHNRADTDEIVNDTFVRAHRALANFRGDSSRRTWLHPIAMHLARNRSWFQFRRRHLAFPLAAPVVEKATTIFAEPGMS